MACATSDVFDLARVFRALVDFTPPYSVPALVKRSGASSGVTYRVAEFLECEDILRREPGKVSGFKETLDLDDDLAAAAIGGREAYPRRGGCPPWELVASTLTSLQGGPDEQRPQELQLVGEREAGERRQVLQIYGQELNHVTYAIAKMNMIIHDIDGQIAIGPRAAKIWCGAASLAPPQRRAARASCHPSMSANNTMYRTTQIPLSARGGNRRHTSLDNINMNSTARPPGV